MFGASVMAILYQFDVIIVGAGPAGSSCAYNLKRFNPQANILLLDKSIFPRYKPCGGGISPEVRHYFDFDLSEAIHFRCSETAMDVGGESIHSDGHEILMVRREDFDHYLLTKAQLSGVHVLTECEVISVEKNGSYSAVLTKRGDFRARYVIIAEGGRGYLARKLGFSSKKKVFAAMEYEHYTTSVDDILRIDFNDDRGYAWRFPKADGISFGMGGLYKGDKPGVKLPQRLKEYLKQYHVTHLDKKHLYGHPIQLYSGRQKLVDGRVMLIGEAGGCVDPLTAEGIRPAIKSGYLAAQILAKALIYDQPKQIKKYNRLFHQEIGKDFQYARVMSYFVYRHRKFIIPYIRSKQALNTFMDVFSGRSCYREQISKHRLGKLLVKKLLNKR